MLNYLSRLLLAVWFVGIVVTAVRGIPVQAQMVDGASQTYFPLMLRDVPADGEPPLNRYIAVGTSNSDGDLELFTVRADGSEVHQLTNNSVDDHSPMLSPDGTLIAFVQGGKDPDPSSVMVMNLDGSDVRVLDPASGLRWTQFQWSPTSDSLLMVGHTPTKPWMRVLYWVKLDGSTPPLFLTDTFGDEADWGWSPDGNFIHYGQGLAREFRIRSLITGEVSVIGLSPSRVVWHPDSTEIFYIETDESVGPSGRMMSVATGTSRLLYTGTDEFLGWVGQGDTLLIRNLDQIPPYNLATVDREGGEAIFLTDYPNGVLGTTLAPNGASVIYTTYNGQNFSHLYSHVLAGEPQLVRALIEGQGFLDVAWAQNGVSFLLLLTESPIGPTVQYYAQPAELPRWGMRLNENSYSVQVLFLPFSSRYGFIQEPSSYRYEPSPAMVPLLVDSIEGTLTPLPFPYDDFKPAEWRYLP